MSHTETLEQAHQLIDRMAPSQVSAVVTLLETMLDPTSLAIAKARYDDEPETEAERLAVLAAKEQHKEQPEDSLTQEEFLKTFGVSTASELM